MGNSNMHQAKRNKKDEFYTRLTDIEKELLNYKKHFKDKVVYCNTDNPDNNNKRGKGSQFWKYFELQFDHLGLKKLIASHYSEDGNAYKYEYDGKDVVKTKLKGNGDFRSEEAIELLKEADIVVTNPPFSLFREYVSQLVDYDKKFLIMGNNNAITYKEVFPLIKEEKLWLGYHVNKTMEFALPDDYDRWDRIEDGIKYGKVPAISWFTNLEVKRRQEPMILFHIYKGNEDKYPKYDNYDAIEVSRVNSIPKDYEGIMGVPITFLTKHTPVQFEILGMSKTPICHNNDIGAQRIKVYDNVRQYNNSGVDVGSGNKVNDGVVLVVPEVPNQGLYYKRLGSDDIMIAKYARILIKNKNPEI